ncbi:hypothetical protein CEXT_358281 [Caerostris extrusa]|uniref:Uncharacterized protein n=1 Tax=Caerostris extrusa TaxID=172846 RepID=A0AAV4XJM5_CAEEX|nr:hypothetical protein CEXT_358281 [Caerostris extrusa]
MGPILRYLSGRRARGHGKRRRRRKKRGASQVSKFIPFLSELELSVSLHLSAAVAYSEQFRDFYPTFKLATVGLRLCCYTCRWKRGIFN